MSADSACQAESSGKIGSSPDPAIGTISARFAAIQALVPNANGENASGRRRALSAIIPPMAERVYAEFSDGRKGWYIVTEDHPDGSLVIAPDKTRPPVDAGEAGCDPGSPPSDAAR
jgi:hypothetical protein